VAAIVIGAIVVISGAIAAIVFVDRDQVVPLAGGGTGVPSAPAPATTTTPAEPSPTSRFTQPDSIGPFSRSSDQSAANAVIQAFPRSIQDAFAVVYDETSDSSQHLLVAGGTTFVPDPASGMNEIFAGVLSTQPGAKVSDRRAADSGSLGGTAQCETLTGSSGAIVYCVWIGDGEFIEMAFININRVTADPLVPTVLEAVAV
jgi:hypothetical protein